MFKEFKGRSIICVLLSMIVAAGLLAGLGGKAFADESTAEVSNAAELTAALSKNNIKTIIITESFDVPCMTASVGNGTSYFTVDRSMTIKGKNANVTLTRTIASGATNGELQSIFGIKGDGNYDGVQVSMASLKLDGGARFGTTKGLARNSMSANDAKVAGRSVVDVYYKATLNLDDGLTIENGYTTCNYTSVNASGGSNTYGGGVRVDYDTTTGGGTVNVKAGSCIRSCVAGGYGGGIGSYSYSRLNVYGGLIQDCSADLGGGVGCTWRASHNATVSGTFKMYGGTIRECSAEKGGAILADGDPAYCFNALYGGTILNCSATEAGSALALRGGSDDGAPSIAIAPYSENGPLYIKNCDSLDGDVDPKKKFGNTEFGYKGINLAGQEDTVLTIESAMCSVVFKTYKDDTNNYAVLTVKTGSSLGESFPERPNVFNTFLEWNTAPDGSGMTVTKDIPIKTNMVVYARWLSYVEGTTSEDLTITYGDKDKYIEIIDAYIPYGGEILYQWCEVVDVPEYEWPLVDIEGETSSRYNLPILNVGTHRFACQLSNHIPPQTLGHASDTITVTVNPRVLNLSWSDVKFVYDGQAKVPTATVNNDLDDGYAVAVIGTYTPIGIVEGDDVKVEVTGAQTDIGTYKATAKLTGKDAGNYVIANGTDTCEFTIDPAPTATPTATVTPVVTAMPTTDPAATAAPTTAPQTTPAADDQVALTLNKASVSVICGNTDILKATLKGSSDKITWSTSDKKVATVDANGKVNTKMAGTVTITAAAAGKTATCTVTVLYKDVTKTKDFWYAPTNYLTAAGVVKGYDKQTKFKPANMCTRAQMVTFIWRLQGEPAPKAKTCKFKDVKKTDYFYKACIWGNENHIVEGYKNGTFGPQIVCARKHAVTFLWRLANKPNPSSKTNKFKDVKKSDYFYTATLWASEKKILAGYDDGTFRPDGDCLRRQMVTFLYKYDKFVNGKG